MIELFNVSKTYKLKSGRKTILNGVTASIPWKNIGVLGRNGAGKSTFLRLISGIEEPDSGIVKRSKSFSWPIGFRGSFHPMLSGIENVRFVARLYGQNTEEMIDKVEDFAELGQFFYEPVKTYSSGMGARLAFGLSMAIKFEVFLVDEVMAVGDAKFQAKSKAAFKAMLPTSRIIMVSHSMSSIREYCDSGLVIDNGRMTYFEDLEEAIARYAELNK
ncbi:ABC transporter ATP-binding protein [Cognatishimia activa]|uniref:Polysialic acid transport ATP-binding protein KpsT n=1 Tax=Cognatishimia activa TaxID=1715691 RepID=A0A0P1IV85_9RHOB|nr:ABC transporter ATP-binding protein [Cognatishimia activa]CUJ17394.1 Polysialic acid transport ATP-binding protein KpsT [Cognatishimia activa]CUK27559.1 Polysialic acid transport ATP-binding protein KpsT [Cognatishimia activa]